MLCTIPLLSHVSLHGVRWSLSLCSLNITADILNAALRPGGDDRGPVRNGATVGAQEGSLCGYNLSRKFFFKTFTLPTRMGRSNVAIGRRGGEPTLGDLFRRAWRPMSSSEPRHGRKATYA